MSIYSKVSIMTEPSYALPPGGLPGQDQLLSDRAVFRNAFAFLPAGVLRDIVTSALPHWEQTRAWILARPMSGFAETFCQSILEVEPGGGSDYPEPDAQAEGAFFVMSGRIELRLIDRIESLSAGGFAWIAPGASYELRNTGDERAVFHWIRKAYQPVEGITPPQSFATHERAIPSVSMPDTADRWQTKRFIDPQEIAHDMHINIVTFEPGGVIPFTETHVMEHGLYVLEGKAVYRLNDEWIEVTAGDFIWLRAFCPQACYAGGTGRFRYLLYKDVNRHPRLDVTRTRTD